WAIFSKNHHLVLLILCIVVFEVFGYHTQNLRRALCLVTAILTLGAVQLMFYWRPEWWVWTSCIPCPLQEADTILLRTTVRKMISRYKATVE
uniref:Cation-transporting ATPase n=1 Tax=Mus spicilegus TaxID=10103 RepID=A0A8C6GNT4_MUSSI